MTKQDPNNRRSREQLSLPEAYLTQMKALFGEDFPAFLAATGEPPFRGIRRNPLKCDEETLFSFLPFAPVRSPFSPFGYYAPEEFRPGQHPAHHAGMFYMQEPSAGSAVTVLDPCPGEKILDLCAAPGGKSTQIAGMLEGKGLLVSNEVVGSRCGALCSNLERFGARNAAVTNCRPDRLAAALPGFFDKVLVDAPCSGEGMFRRDPAALTEWTPDSPAACAARQREILSSAAALVRPGGVLVYSTCTFSKEENEETAARFLEDHPEFSLCPTGVSFGRAVMDGCAVRIDPLCGGEGHFAVKFMKREGETPSLPSYSPVPLPPRLLQMARELYKECFTDDPEGLFFAFFPSSGEKENRGKGRGKNAPPLPSEGKLCLLPAPPETLPSFEGLSPVKMGVDFALLRGDRLAPCHGIFLAKKGEECRQSLSFDQSDPRLAAFLRGEELPCDPALQGYVSVCLHGVPLGFGKASGGRLKNKYPKGLRNNK